MNSFGLIHILLAIYLLLVAAYGIYAHFSPRTTDDRLYAGFLRRAAAYLIDIIALSVILSIMLTAVVLSIYWIYGNEVFMVNIWAVMYEIDQIPKWYFCLLAGFLVWIYFAVMESSKYQATIGKKAMRLKVVDKNGDKIRFVRAAGRNIAKIISGIILGFGYFMIGWTRQKQGLHDKITNCLVVRRSRSQ